MKIIDLIVATMAASLMLASCVKNVEEGFETVSPDAKDGVLSVRLMNEGMHVKGGDTSSDLEVLEQEKKVVKVSVLVFDQATGMLNASKELETLNEECTMSVPVGQKVIYAVVNGPDLGEITRLSQMGGLVDNLSESDMLEDGLTMLGSEVCVVQAGVQATPVVGVKRLVSRVVLKRVACNIAQQYGGMTIDCVYLGNANTVQYGSGMVDGMVNPDGYADADRTSMIGKGGVSGSCAGYMYRKVAAEVPVNGEHAGLYHMYCQPNKSSEYTCLYLLTTIGGVQYYYRVPLNKGLEANHTCSVEILISNLGSLTPPHEDYQNGSIQASISIEGWSAGNGYVTEF